MQRIEIKSWGDLSEESWSSLILGNGASIAIHENFAYSALHSVAAEMELLPTTTQVFEQLGTTDFEHVLLGCWYAERVNTALGSPSPAISNAYSEVRTALIESVHSLHPVYTNVSDDLERVGVFASKFPTVLSLNYDLTLYWAMLKFNAAHGLWFKDAFHNGEFQKEWNYLRQPYGAASGATLVFYPHGNLAFARDFLGEESKLSAGSVGDLLQTITERWESKHYVPIFVSEGTSHQKISAIRRSQYLTNVFENVMPGLGDKLVVYGWSFDVRDKHLLDAILASTPEKIAVSVFTDQSAENQQAFCHQVMTAIEKSLGGAEVIFFDSKSSGCWNNP
jgi:hypothetical protein